MYTFSLTAQIYKNNKIKETTLKTPQKHSLVFPFLKNKAS